jgi:hypothetical protein
MEHRMDSQGGEVKAPSTQPRASAYPLSYVSLPSGPPILLDPTVPVPCITGNTFEVIPVTSYVCPCCQRRSLTSVVVNGVTMCAPCALEDSHGS